MPKSQIDIEPEEAQTCRYFEQCMEDGRRSCPSYRGEGCPLKIIRTDEIIYDGDDDVPRLQRPFYSGRLEI